MENQDFIRSFIIDDKNIRGKILKSNIIINEIISRHSYDEFVSQVLAEALSAVIMLAYDLKHNGILTMQFHSEGQMKFMVVDATNNLDARGYIELKSDYVHTENFNDLLSNGRMVITLDPGEGMDRYQGVVDIKGNDIPGIIEEYMLSSEQLPTKIKIFSRHVAGKLEIAALLLQSLPYASNSKQISNDNFDDKWQEIQMFTDTITEEELFSDELNEVDILKRLYGIHKIIVFDRREIGSKCRCSHLRALKVLKSISKEELETLRIDGKVVIKCQFCNKESFFEDV